MNYEKMTKSTIEALNKSQVIANEYGNTSIDTEHILLGLLEETNGLVSEIFNKLEINTDEFKSEIIRLIERKSKVSGQSQVYLSVEGQTVIDKAKKKSSHMSDEYISVEHVLLSIIENSNKHIKDIFMISLKNLLMRIAIFGIKSSIT